MGLERNIRRRPGRPSGDTDLRPAILAAAEAGFAAGGFGAASVRAIAQQAGVSAAAVLHHFSSKGELYHAVLVRIGDSLEAAVTGLPKRAGADAAQAVVEALVDWVRGNPVYARIVLHEIMENEERVRRARRWPLRTAMTAIYDAMRAALARPAGDPAPELLALQCLGAAFFFYTGQPTHLSQLKTPIPGWEDAFCAQLVATARQLATPPADQRR